MSFTTSYRPPPPAPSAFFAMQLAAQSAVQAPSQTSSAYLPRISSKMSLNMSSGGAHTLPIISAGIVQTAPASRNNSASSITALPSLSSSLNNLHSATSLDHVDIVGTQTPEAEELVRKNHSHPSCNKGLMTCLFPAAPSNTRQCKTNVKPFNGSSSRL